MYCEGIMWRRRVTNFLSGHREISDVLRTAAVLPVLWGGERGGGCEDSLRICVARSPCCPLSRVDIAGGKHGTVRTGEPAHQPLRAASPSLLVVLENVADGNPQISVGCCTSSTDLLCNSRAGPVGVGGPRGACGDDRRREVTSLCIILNTDKPPLVSLGYVVSLFSQHTHLRRGGWKSICERAGAMNRAEEDPKIKICADSPV